MKTKVLMVDDEPSFTSSVKCNLEEIGNYEVEIVNDSTIAIDRIRESKPDVILLDIIMPGADGGDILNELEADPELATIPVLVVTAMISSDEPTEDGMVKFGEHVLLPKPISAENLTSCIEKRLAGKI